MKIRIAADPDRDAVRHVYLAAFSENEREPVSRLAVNLLSEEATPKTLSLVAEVEGLVVGHVAFSPVTACARDVWQGYILAPLGVEPDYQNHGIGAQLVENGMQQLSKSGVNILFVYGDPKYYGRFGFSADAAVRYIPPYKLQFPFGWQGITLNKYREEESAIRIACVGSLCDPELW